MGKSHGDPLLSQAAVRWSAGLPRNLTLTNGGLLEVQLSARQHAIVGRWLFALPHGSGATAPLKGKLDLNGGLSSCSTHPYQGYPSICHCEHRYGFMQVNHCQSERIVIGLSNH
jgi:hypothetical protein